MTADTPSNLCPFPQHAARVAEATAIVLSPGEYDREKYLLAWSCLKTARGQTVHQTRLRRMDTELPLILRPQDRVSLEGFGGGAA